MLQHNKKQQAQTEKDKLKNVIDGRIQSAYSGTPSKLKNAEGMKSKHKAQKVTLHWRDLNRRTKGTILGLLTAFGLSMIMSVFVENVPIRIAIALILLLVCLGLGYVLGRTTE